MLGLTVSKIIEETNCDLDVAFAWAVSTKNYLKNVNGFSPNQLVFEKIAQDDLLTALEIKLLAKQLLKIKMHYILPGKKFLKMNHHPN